MWPVYEERMRASAAEDAERRLLRLERLACWNLRDGERKEVLEELDGLRRSVRVLTEGQR